MRCYFFVHVKHHDLHHVADGDGLARMLDKLVAHLRNVDQTVLMHADIHEHAEVDDVAHRAGEHHAGL